MCANEVAPPPPEGYRLLQVGEMTQRGDVAFMVWARGAKREWVELRAGHTLNARIVRSGRVARMNTPPPAPVELNTRS
jgi:hypothetical protein